VSVTDQPVSAQKVEDAALVTVPREDCLRRGLDLGSQLPRTLGAAIEQDADNEVLEPPGLAQPLAAHDLVEPGQRARSCIARQELRRGECIAYLSVLDRPTGLRLNDFYCRMPGSKPWWKRKPGPLRSIGARV
jgi:hypothetical protein